MLFPEKTPDPRVPKILETIGKEKIDAYIQVVCYYQLNYV
jgi:hypothetical protein